MYNRRAPRPTSAQVLPYSDATYPQIVRIRYAEGDVRGSPFTSRATWETAVWYQASLIHLHHDRLS